ncbi:hypothetical protein VTO42DRAFT_4596 [Malbranchea cinnamomea]
MDKEKVQVFAVSLADIDMALKPKSYTDPHIKLPEHYHQFLNVFDHKRAETLPPLRSEGVDHRIELTEDKAKMPWGPLYQSSLEELLVLKRELNSLLDKGFIRVSNSPSAAPVLFVKKPEGGLRFCVDYRRLNVITKKDLYLLPLINETLQRVGCADWFTKLDIIAVFHKISTPFGLANTPSTFQKFINWTLREYLDEFVSAYIDDILIFTTGSLHKHRQHVEKVLLKLPEGVLHPCAYFSQKNSPAECNYEIHDKELLVIVKCCHEWESELKSIRDFLVLIDHKNLTYFTTTKKLNERQICCQEFLSQFNFRIKYRPGREGTLPDVLSRREQDMPQDADDQFVHREACLLKPEVFVNTCRAARVNYLRVATPPLYAKPATTNVTLDPSEWQELEALWKTVELNDAQWQAAV